MAGSIAFVVITGMSGAGKSYAIKCFEDMGFFCVDNLPTTLIPTFADLIARSTRAVEPGGLGVDVREASTSRICSTRWPSCASGATPPRSCSWRRARSRSCGAIARRRRRHPLARRRQRARRHPRRAQDALHAAGGRRSRGGLLGADRAPAQAICWSSTTSRRGRQPGLSISLVSFGFKHGVPFDADLVFDVRFLPNPTSWRRCARWTGATAGCGTSS